MIKKKEMGELKVNSIRVREMVIGEGIPKICIPIVGETQEEILREAGAIIGSVADLVEWRVDWFESAFDIEKIISLLEGLRKILGDLPLLFTFRTKGEGGEKEIGYEQYAELLRQVADTKLVDIIDVEAYINGKVKTLIRELKEKGAVIIGSNHDFEKTPLKEEIIRRLCHMQEIGADIPKIAVMPRSAEDVLTLLDATAEMTSNYAHGPIVTMSMDRMGAVSRVAGEIFGSAITFGTLQKVSAPGQIQAEKLKEILDILRPF